MSLIQLIYVSSASHELGQDELDSILDAAACNNAALQVTGMLLYAGGSFMQILEGEAAAVDQIFERVSHDSRHANIFVLERDSVSRRSFARWHMGFKRLDGRDAAEHPAYAAYFGHGFNAADFAAHPGLAVDMLNDFARSQRAGGRI